MRAFLSPSLSFLQSLSLIFQALDQQDSNFRQQSESASAVMHPPRTQSSCWDTSSSARLVLCPVTGKLLNIHTPSQKHTSMQLFVPNRDHACNQLISHKNVNNQFKVYYVLKLVSSQASWLVQHFSSDWNILKKNWMFHHRLLFTHSDTKEDEFHWLCWSSDISSSATITLTFLVGAFLSSFLAPSLQIYNSYLPKS